MLRTALIVGLSVGVVLAGVTAGQAEEQGDQAPWKIRVELSHVRTSGNTDTETLSGKLEAKKEGEIHRYILKGNALHAEDEGEETANKWLLDGRWERVLREDLFGFLTASYLRDKFSGYDYRANGGLGLGYDLIKTKQHQVKGLISTLYSQDKFSEADKGSKSYMSGKAAIYYVWQLLENLRFKENADYLVSFEDTDTYFINSETALEVEVNGTISLGLSYSIAYQHRPPSPDFERTDTLFLASLIIDL
jgi:putative salt-induced outer membrane protein